MLLTNADIKCVGRYFKKTDSTTQDQYIHYETTIFTLSYVFQIVFTVLCVSNSITSSSSVIFLISAKKCVVNRIFIFS